MDPYLLLVFLHVLGAVGFFTALGIEAVALHRLRAATSIDQARTWLPLLQRPGGPSGHLAMLTILVTGMWMMALRWGAEAWMLTALAAVVAIIAVATLLRSSLARLTAALSDAVDSDWRQAAHARGLSASLWLRVGLAVGILGLMTAKPGLIASLAITAAAVMAGTVLSIMIPAGVRQPA